MNKERRFMGNTSVLPGVITAIFLLGWQTHAASTMPAEWSFEGLNAGDPIVDTNGVSMHGMWEGSGFSPTNHAAEVVAVSYAQPLGGYPLPFESTHDKAMQILGDISNNFDFAADVNVDPTNVWIDLIAQPGQLSFRPEPPADAQFAAYVDTNGLVVVLHATYDAGFNLATPMWSTLDNASIATGAFVRISVLMYYITDFEISNSDFTENWFQIYVDGGDPLTSTNGYSNTSPASGTPDGGPWFLAADSGFDNATPGARNNNYLSAVAFSGAGIVDDIYVGEDRAAFSTNTPSLTPFQLWLQANGLPVSNQSATEDADEDESSNWAEYVAGTDPNDPDSVFQIVRTEFKGASNCIWWVVGTETNLTTDFYVLRATNLSAASPWSVIASNLTRTSSGTNVWYDTAPPAMPAFYRPGLENPAP